LNQKENPPKKGSIQNNQGGNPKQALPTSEVNPYFDRRQNIKNVHQEYAFNNNENIHPMYQDQTKNVNFGYNRQVYNNNSNYVPNIRFVGRFNPIQYQGYNYKNYNPYNDGGHGYYGGRQTNGWWPNY
jgi:hypothetical protein